MCPSPILMILMRVLPPPRRMKTPFFIFSLAESAAVPADVKAQLYTHAYKVHFSFVAGHGLGGGSAWGGGRACKGMFTLVCAQVILSIIKRHTWGNHSVCRKQCQGK